MHLHGNIQNSILVALVTLVGATLAPASLAHDEVAASSASKPVRCGFTAYTEGALKGTATPAITASPGGVSIDPTGIAICTGDKGKYFSFALKGTGNFSCDGVSTFTGELQLEEAKAVDAEPTFGANAGKAQLSNRDANGTPLEAKNTLMVAAGEFTSGPFKSSTAMVVLKAKPGCAAGGITSFVSRDLSLSIGPAE
jgi:hypothetical protein